ncbi:MULTISPECIES: hypothetical protein [Planktothricoides]|uniref:Uncharacterized protein n=1 Tax=Planktothricoides raciborskii GIHE-MW2 TaxID=2792601 RepID=A0AAU8JC95_9CYAN|nr:hypothetical protein [Planktothricoides sp. SR001]KOR37987.1 hypothetical protein AM228_04185 [Planktothricoides sp. SR001]
MTWHMQSGDRVLEGYEAEFYLKVLQTSFLTDWDIFVFEEERNDLKDFQLWANTGNNFFHRASFNQQIYLINFCLKALLKPDVPMPELDHILEAAAFYPFAYLSQMIDEEISQELHWAEIENEPEPDEYNYFYRQIAWDAFEKMILPDLLEYEEEEEEEYDQEDSVNLFYEQKYKSTDLSEWQFAVDCLADIILWDRDWFFVTDWPQLLDGMDPAYAEAMGITENYFTNRLPKVSDEEAIELLREIMEWELPET